MEEAGRCKLTAFVAGYALGGGNHSIATSTLQLSRASNVVMLLAYFAYIFFQLKTHRKFLLSFEMINGLWQMFIEEVIELVELNPLKHEIVGLPGVNGLSTEQRKRLTISVELVANPSIIFMDEPTSGLDARAAAVVMRAIGKIVDTGRTVVCTIHQPSIDIFESFDEVNMQSKKL
ncbi:ABC transporter G family member 53 [Glycine soja]